MVVVVSDGGFAAWVVAEKATSAAAIERVYYLSR
jgi:hypothetical protein